MNKMIMNRLTMLAVTLMASIACFAQGKLATSIPGGMPLGKEFNYLELKYKVLDNSKGYTVEVIGFADAFVADPSQFDKAEEGVEIKTHNTVTISHIIGESDKVEVKTYIARVADGALNTDNATLAAKVTALEIDYSNDITATAPVIIGENAFAGLTSLATVKSFTPGTKVAAIPATSFATSVYKTATLIVPDGSMGKYNQKAGWKNFYSIKNMSGKILGDYDGIDGVDQADAIKLQRALKKSLTGSLDPYDEALDFNNDGSVDQGDYILFTRKLKSQE